MTPPDRTRALVGAGVIAVIALMMVWTTRELEKVPVPVARKVPGEESSAATPPGETTRAAAPLDPDNQLIPPSVGEVPQPAAKGNVPPGDARIVATELEEVQSAIGDFRSALGGNPVGTNAEITRALLGDNLKQVKLPIPQGSRLNGEGELCDRWNTPYFFHQISGDKMEVRSAGPDQTMWTADDLQM